MQKTYFNPGCALSVYKPHLEWKILDYLNKDGDIPIHKICCRHNPRVPEGSRIITVCAGCRRRYEKDWKFTEPVTLWEVIDGREDFPFPDYGGLEMSVQDACPLRKKPEVHAAVRSLLRKMNIKVVETELHGANSICCGDNVYGSLPLDEALEKMRARAGAMPRADAAVYCVSCLASMLAGGIRPRHMADLLFGEETDADACELVSYRGRLEEYAENH